jgi:hypothetical protein
MEKLIELLNEYRPEKILMLTEVQTLYFISKKGGFIKWLVDNDKIDYHNKINYDISLAINRVPKKTTREERLLMMLAIQDNPIEFLISILK